MLFRLKCYLLSLLAFAVALVLAYFTALPAMYWLQDRFPGELAVQLGGMFLWLVGLNVLFLAMVWLLRCPQCHRHFSLRNYLVDGWLHLVPPRTCPACGADMFDRVPPQSTESGLRAA